MHHPIIHLPVPVDYAVIQKAGTGDLVTQPWLLKLSASLTNLPTAYSPRAFISPNSDSGLLQLGNCSPFSLPLRWRGILWLPLSSMELTFISPPSSASTSPVSIETGCVVSALPIYSPALGPQNRKTQMKWSLSCPPLHHCPPLPMNRFGEQSHFCPGLLLPYLSFRFRAQLRPSPFLGLTSPFVRTLPKQCPLWEG